MHFQHAFYFTLGFYLKRAHIHFNITICISHPIHLCGVMRPLGGGGYNYQIEISAKYSDTRIIGHSDEFTGESPTFYKSVVS